LKNSKVLSETEGWKLKMLKTHEFTTKKGLRVLILHRPEKYTTGFSLIINAGSIYETEKTSGISHFFEHLFFNGTKSHPSEQILREEMQEIGLGVGARTVRDQIEVYGSFPTEELENSLGLLKEIVFDSVLEETSINKERGVIFSEIAMRNDSNDTVLWEEAIKLRFKKGNPLGRPIGGTRESVGNITRDEIIEYYKKYCVAKNSVLVVASNASFEKLEEEIEKAFENATSGERIPEKDYSMKDMSGKIISTIEKTTEHIYLMVSFPSKWEDELNRNWQRGFMTGLISEALNKSLRMENGIVYDVYASGSGLSKNAGIFCIGTSFHPEAFPKVTSEIFKAIQDAKEGIFDIKTFERVRKTGNRTLPMNFDSMGGAMNWVVNSFYYNGEFYSPEEVIEARNKVTSSDMQKRANEILDFSKINVVSLGDIKQTELIFEVEKYI